MKDERFIVTYRIEADTYEDAKSIAWAVQVEQTIEFPYEFVTDPYIKIQFRSIGISRTDGARFRICNCGSDAECSD